MIDLSARRCLVAAGLLFSVAHPAIAGSELHAVDDVFVAVDRAPWTIDVEKLLTNDLAVGAHVELLTLPERGTLDVIESEPDTPLALTYDPGFVWRATWDRFTYRLVAGAAASDPATVWIRRQPRLRPVAGRWPTPTCNDTACPYRLEVGAQAEIGFYDTVAAAFELCDWIGPTLDACRTVHLPPPFDRPGWEPLVGDWDGDGWVDFGVYDVTDGGLQLFRLVAADAYEGRLPDRLEPLAASQLGAVGDLPVSGWWNDGATAQLGVFRPSTRRFLLEGRATPLAPPGDPDVASEPLAGDWWIGGGDELGLWSPDTGHLVVFDSVRPESFRELTIHHSLTEVPLAGDAFSGHLVDPSSLSFVGVYDAVEGLIHLRTLCGGCGALALQVIVDP